MEGDVRLIFPVRVEAPALFARLLLESLALGWTYHGTPIARRITGEKGEGKFDSQKKLMS